MAAQVRTVTPGIQLLFRVPAHNFVWFSCWLPLITAGYRTGCDFKRVRGRREISENPPNQVQYEDTMPKRCYVS